MARRLRAVAAACACLFLTACQPGILDPKGTVGIEERTILIDSLAIMLAIVVPTIAATLAFAWWYRRDNNRAAYHPEWAHSNRIELMVWSVPALTVMLLSGVTWIGAHALDPKVPITSDKPALEVQVVSLDWKWLFIYPDQHVASLNRLVVPAGVPVHFSLTSSSVMNAFFVPQLGSMIYAMNGMVSQLNLQADAPGQFAGLSAHFSGDGFSDMHFVVESVSPDEFGAWAKGASAAGDVLDEAAYTTLAKQSVETAARTWRSVDGGLFDKIANQTIPPAPGPPDVVSPPAAPATGGRKEN